MLLALLLELIHFAVHMNTVINCWICLTQVDIVINFHDEINLAYAVDPKFEKSKKRRLQGVQLQVVDHNFAFERRDEGGYSYCTAS